MEIALLCMEQKERCTLLCYYKSFRRSEAFSSCVCDLFSMYTMSRMQCLWALVCVCVYMGLGLSLKRTLTHSHPLPDKHNLPSMALKQDLLVSLLVFLGGIKRISWQEYPPPSSHPRAQHSVGAHARAGVLPVQVG